MKNKDLIRLLQSLPADAPIMVKKSVWSPTQAKLVEVWEEADNAYMFMEDGKPVIGIK